MVFGLSAATLKHLQNILDFIEQTHLYSHISILAIIHELDIQCLSHLVTDFSNSHELLEIVSQERRVM